MGSVIEPKDFEPYAMGLVCASACAVATMSVDEVAERLNAAHPTGISSRWAPSKDSTFASGQPNPCPCDRHPTTHMHYLFNC